jgi:hypothetical protein
MFGNGMKTVPFFITQTTQLMNGRIKNKAIAPGVA